MSRTFENRFQP